MRFTSQDNYFQKLFVDKKYSRDKVIFLSNAELSLLGHDIFEKKLSTYYGIATLRSFISADQLTVKSCQGQITNLYHSFEKDKSIIVNDASSVEVLKNLKLNPAKKTIIFLYSYKLGRLSKVKIDSVIAELQYEEDFDYRIVSLDNNDIVQLN